jgi:osmoprotectant transport system permease protein
VLTGVVLTMALALLFDVLLVVLGRVIMPWTRKDREARARVPLVMGEAAA